MRFFAAGLLRPGLFIPATLFPWCFVHLVMLAASLFMSAAQASGSCTSNQRQNDRKRLLRGTFSLCLNEVVLGNDQDKSDPLLSLNSSRCASFVI